MNLFYNHPRGFSCFLQEIVLQASRMSIISSPATVPWSVISPPFNLSQPSGSSQSLCPPASAKYLSLKECSYAGTCRYDYFHVPIPALRTPLHPSASWTCPYRALGSCPACAAPGRWTRRWTRGRPCSRRSGTPSGSARPPCRWWARASPSSRSSASWCCSATSSAGRPCRCPSWSCGCRPGQAAPAKKHKMRNETTRVLNMALFIYLLGKFGTIVLVSVMDHLK